MTTTTTAAAARARARTSSRGVATRRGRGRRARVETRARDDDDDDDGNADWERGEEVVFPSDARAVRRRSSVETSSSMSSARGSTWTRRRALVSTVALATAAGGLGGTADAAADGDEPPPEYAIPGPYRVRVLPQLEHTCAKCFPACTGLSCLSRIKVYVPRVEVLPDALFPLGRAGGSPFSTLTSNAADEEDRGSAPYPVAIITPGFLIDGDAYASIARRLCSWGYVVVTYTKTESVAGGTLDDEVSAAILDDLISWVGSDVLISPYADASSVYLLGHSRGGKISMLQATRDERVKAVCLLDPVDNTVYAPLGVGYPSALAAMKVNPAAIPPVAIIGGVNGGECAPPESNYAEFFAASPSGAVSQDHPPWGVSCGAGHFDFVDETTFVQKVICPEGTIDASATRDLSAAVAVAHGERVFRPRGVADSILLDRTLASVRGQWANRGTDFSSVQLL